MSKFDKSVLLPGTAARKSKIDKKDIKGIKKKVTKKTVKVTKKKVKKVKK
tara:strand:- start:664 stop:813 length:150 start_codon:yes stop_codon:yes gene_type:complete